MAAQTCTLATLPAQRNHLSVAVQKKGRILVIDRPQFSVMIAKMLARRYEVICTNDVAEGLSWVNEQGFDAVIVDAQVTGGGLQVVECMKMSLNMRHIPVLLTCIQPTEEWVRYVKMNGIARLIAKPFRPSTLLAQLEGMLQNPSSSKQNMNDVEAVVEAIQMQVPVVKRLIPKPPVLGAQMTDDGLFDALSQNSVAEAAVLALGNKAYSPAWRKIDSAKLAVNMMGVKEATMLVQCVGALQQLKTFAAKSHFNLAALSKRAIGTAFVARALGNRVAVDQSKCFWAGLVHDFGKVMLDASFSAAYAGVRDAVLKGRIPYVCAEESFFGFSHSLASGYLANVWELGEDVVEAVLCHHDLLFAKRHTKLTSVLFVAALLCGVLEFGSDGEPLKPAPSDPLLAKAYWKLGLTPKSYDMLVDMAQKELKYAQLVVDAIFQDGAL